jgi:hypothetical protein
MSTTSSTHQARSVPLLASLAVAGVIAAVGVGVGWHESNTSSTGGQASAVTPPNAASFRNVAVAERELAQNGQGVPNARVAERNLQQYDGQAIGRGDFQPPTGGGKTVGGP